MQKNITKWHDVGEKHNLTSEDVVVVLLHDHGSRYIAKVYNDEWMKSVGFL